MDDRRSEPRTRNQRRIPQVCLVLVSLGFWILVFPVVGCSDSSSTVSTTMASPPATATTVPPPAPPPVAPAAGYRVSDQDLNYYGLEQVWTDRLHETETIIDAYVLGDAIVMETAGRRLYGIDRRTGTPKWCVEIPNRCDFRGCEDDAQVYVPCRNVLVAIDKRGYVTWRKFLDFAPGGVPIADDQHVYMPCYDGRMRAFLKESGYFAWQYTTRGPVEAKPALGFRLVYAGSNDGIVYALTTDKLDYSWEYKTFGPIRAGLIYDKMRVYAASTDGSLYCLASQPQQSREQQLAWNRPFATGAAIEKTPYLGADMVLVINKNRECNAVDRGTGRKLWLVADVDQVLTQGRVNTYFLRGTSTIVAVDNKSGSIRWQLPTPAGAVAFFPTNTVDDMLYFVKTTGEIQAVREVRPAKAPVAKEEAPAKPEPAKAAKPAE